MGTTTALSVDRNFDPAENVKAWRSTLVILYRTKTPLFSAIFYADDIARLGFTCLTSK